MENSSCKVIPEPQGTVEERRDISLDTIIQGRNSNIPGPGSGARFKKTKLEFSKLQTKPVNRIVLQTNEKRSTVPFKRVL